MAAVSSPFEIVKDFNALVKKFASLDINKKFHQGQLDDCKTVVDEVDKDLQIFMSIFVRYNNINAPQRDLAKSILEQCPNNINTLKKIIEEIESTAGTRLYHDIANDQFVRFSDQQKNLKEKLETLYSYIVEMQGQLDRMTDSFHPMFMTPRNPGPCVS